MSRVARLEVIGHERAERDLDELADVFDMNAGLGAGLLQATADAILAQMVAECDADGDAWPALGDLYAQFKRADVGEQPIGVYHRVMRQPAEIEGHRQVATHEARMTYGLSEQAREHATSFQEGWMATGMAGHKPRPFYYLGKAVVAAAEPVIGQHFLSFQLSTGQTP